MAEQARPGPPPRPTPPPPRDPYAGPYDPANGDDAYGHPVNWCGRCAGMNVDPATCPPVAP